MKISLEALSRQFDVAAAATRTEIEEVDRHFNYPFPADYKAFLQTTNGLEGEEKGYGYLVLWSTKELIELNTAYQVKEFVENVIIFGSDGAENAFGFDITSGAIVKLPFIGMGHIPNEQVADTFEEFLSTITTPNTSFIKRLFG